MFKNYFTIFRSLSTLLTTPLRFLTLAIISASLTACGSSSITDRIVDAVLTTDQKQAIAKQVVRASNPLELVSTITNITELIGFLPTGPMNCTSGSGSGVQTTVDNPPLGSFDSEDSILLDAQNCQTLLGRLDGTLTLTGTSTGTTTVFSNATIDGSSLINGTLELAPSNNFDLLAGTGSLGMKASNFSVTENGNTATLKNGDYNFVLSGSNYTFTADQTYTFNQFPGNLTAKTEVAGFTGDTSINAGGGLEISSPLNGEMIITFPGNSKATVSANTGNETTYSLTVDNTTITQLWDQ